MQEAKSVAYHMRKEKKEILTTYHCPFCGGFHYGHPPAKRPYTRPKRKPLARGHR